MGLRTALGRTEVLARGRSARTSPTSFLNAQGTTFNHLSLQGLLGRISLIGSDHLDKPEATRFLGVRVKHDGAVLDLSIFLKQAGNFLLGETRVNAGDEEIRSGVAGRIITTTAVVTVVGGRRATDALLVDES